MSNYIFIINAHANVAPSNVTRPSNVKIIKSQLLHVTERGCIVFHLFFYI